MNHNLFRLVLANRVCGGSSSASRSFVLAALRALHLDPDCRSTAIRHMAGTRPNNETTNGSPPLQGSPTQIRNTPCVLASPLFSLPVSPSRATLGTAGVASAKHGADDPAVHVRHSQGADDPAGHNRHGGGADDGPNHH